VVESSHTRTTPAWVKAATVAGQRFHFKTKNAFVHNTINLGAFALLLALQIATLALHDIVSPYIYVPVAALILGALYFACIILVVHEASHNMFVLLKERKAQRFWNRFFAWPVSVLYAASHYGKHWERGHLEHHVRPLLPTDPQRFNVLVGRTLYKRLALELFVPGYLFLARTVLRKRAPGGKSSSSLWVIVLFVALWAGILTLLTMYVGGHVALALYLGMHVLSCLNQIKGSLEHGGRIGHEEAFYLRSRTTLFFLRRLLMPFNITLHFEHHLNFCVPWYDLVSYHRALRPIVPRNVWDAVINYHPYMQMSGALGGVPDASQEAHRST